MTRQQELDLIEIGLAQVIHEFYKRKRKSVRKKKGNGRKWTKAQHAKFAKSMAKIWEQKKGMKT